MPSSIWVPEVSAADVVLRAELESSMEMLKESLIADGWTFLGVYQSAINFTTFRQFIRRDFTYLFLDSEVATVPYATTGNWEVEGDLFTVVNAPAAENVTFDNSGTGLSADNVQDAIAEVAASIGPGASFTPTLAADLDAVNVSGVYFADATTLNRILIIGQGYLNGIFDHFQTSSDNALQRFMDTETNDFYHRTKFAGVWSNWKHIETTNLATYGWPQLVSDNATFDVNVATTAGWTGSLANLSTDGSSLSLTGVSSAVESVRTVIASGDWISYMKLQLTSGYVTTSHREPGNNYLLLSLGYRWSLGAAAANYVSLAGRVGGALDSFLEFTVDYTTAPVEFAIHYDSRVNAANLFQRVAGKWVFKGSVNTAGPYSTGTIRMTQGNTGGTTKLYHWLHAKPNLAVIGDSIPAGHTLYDPDPTFYGGTDNYNSTWMAHADLYPALKNNLIVNYGIGSQTSAQIDARMNAMLTAAAPKVVFLHASNNDYSPLVPDATRLATIQASVNKIAAAGAASVVLNSVYPNSNHANYPGNRDYLTAWWTNYSANIGNVNFLVDIMQAPGLMTSGSIAPANAQADGIHPNLTGFPLIGAYVKSLEV